MAFAALKAGATRYRYAGVVCRSAFTLVALGRILTEWSPMLAANCWALAHRRLLCRKWKP